MEEVKGCIVSTLQLAFPPLAPGSRCDHPHPLFPHPDLEQLISLCLLQCPGQESCILQASIEEMAQLALRNLQSDLQRWQESVGALGVSWPINSQSPWLVLARLTSSCPHVLAALWRFSSSLSLTLSTLIRVATELCQDTGPICTTFQRIWKNLIWKELVHIIHGLKLGPDPLWSRCLATVCVGVVVVDVFPDADAAWLLCETQLLDSLDKLFPSLLYQQYQKWEGLEVGGAALKVGGAGELSATDGGGLILKVANDVCSDMSNYRKVLLRVCTSWWMLSPS